MSLRRNDNYFMSRAVKLARKALGRTSPNPPVGCVIVKNNRIIAKGYHEKAGLPHAERAALRKVKNAKNSTMYVTLEPCDHYGKTPPCTDAIIERGIKKVVIGIKDPNPVNNGRGIKKLEKYGIKTKKNIGNKEIESMYKPYIKFIKKGMPFTTLKIAESLDGKIATKTGQSKWISNDLSRKYVQKLRLENDAVMVGVNTVLNDNPTLLPKINSKKRIKRIILDSDLKTPLNSKIIKSKNKGAVLIATSAKSSKSKKKTLLKKGIIVIEAPVKKKKINLKFLLRALAHFGIMNLLVEGGGKISGSLFDEGLVDRVCFFIAPKIIGGEKGISAVRGGGITNLKNSHFLKGVKFKKFGDDIMVEGDVYRNNRRKS